MKALSVQSDALLYQLSEMTEGG